MRAMYVACVADGAWVRGHGLGLGRGHLVMRYTTYIKVGNVEKTSAYILHALINVKLRHTCFCLLLLK